MCTREQVFFPLSSSSFTHTWKASVTMRSKCPWKRVHMKVEKNMRPSLINKQRERVFSSQLVFIVLAMSTTTLFPHYSRYVASESIHVSFVSWLRVEKKSSELKFTCLSLTSARSMKYQKLSLFLPFIISFLLFLYLSKYPSFASIYFCSFYFHFCAFSPQFRCIFFWVDFLTAFMKNWLI